MGRQRGGAGEARARGGVPADKVCETCGRPFSWRKKWERDWDQVRYCSQACRAGRTNPDFKPR